MLTRAEAAALFDKRREAWLAEDIGGYLACWAEDMTFASPMHDPPLEGRAAYEALVRASAETVRPLSFDVHQLAAVGNMVLAEWTITVEGRASGERVCWRGMSSAEYHDGLIVTWREYWNPADLRGVTDD